MTGFRIRYKDDEYNVSEVFADDETPVGHFDSFKAALMFIAVRRQLAMPRNYNFTIEFLGES